MKRIGCVVAVVLLAGCGSGEAASELTPTSSSTTSTPVVPQIQQAANDCLRGHITKDEGMSITLDTKGPKEGNAKIHDEIEDVSCLLGTAARSGDI